MNEYTRPYEVTNNNGWHMIGEAVLWFVLFCLVLFGGLLFV